MPTLKSAFLAVLGLAVLLLAPVSPPARAASAEDHFVKDMHTLRDGMLAYCRKISERLKAGPDLDLSRPTDFRIACARTLEGLEVPFAPGWVFFALREEGAEGGADFIGMERKVLAGDEEWSLAVGWESLRTYKHQEPMRERGFPSAVLYGWQQGAWRVAWRYTDHATGDVKQPRHAWGYDRNNRMFAVPQSVWRRVIEREVHRYLWGLRDSIGSPFEP